MSRHLSMLAALAVAGLASVRPAPAQTLPQSLVEGRLAADLGEWGRAIELFTGVATTPGPPDPYSCEALVRRAAALRHSGRAADANADLTEVVDSCPRDVEARRLLVEHVTGTQQNPDLWRGRTEDFTLAFVDSAAGPVPRIVYGDVDRRDPFQEVAGSASGGGTPISISVKDADLMDLFRLFHEVSGLNIVIHPAVRMKTMTLELEEVPWDQALKLILDSLGLGVSVQGDVMLIAPLAVLADAQFAGDAADLVAQRKTLDTMAAVAAALRPAPGDRLPVHPLVVDARVALAERGSSQPAQDAWGHEIRYWSEGATLRLVSPGRDGILEHPDLVGYLPSIARSPDTDLAWENVGPATHLVTPGSGGKR